MIRGVSLADEFASKSKLNPLFSQSSDLEPLADSNRYKAPDLTSGNNIFEFMQFVMKEANRVLASGDEVSAFQIVNEAIAAIKDRESRKKDKDKSSVFHQLMLMQRLGYIYAQIRSNNERIELLKEVIRETEGLLNTIDGKSFENAKENAHEILTKSGIDADKILANVQDKDDIARIMREFHSERQKEQEDLSRKNEQLEQEVHDIEAELSPVLQASNKTEAQKNAVIQTTLDKRDWETLLAVERKSEHKQLQEKSIELAEKKVKEAQTDTDKDDFFSFDEKEVTIDPTLGPKV